ncbi:MAG: hypothetical protein IKF82_02355 [Bacilli bacterium]|nr:hypothetical protein [Bacilli bacterium]
MKNLEYDIKMCKESIDTLDNDVVVKLLLSDGTVRDIGGFLYNKRKDGILYIEEMNQNWIDYNESVWKFVNYGKQIIKASLKIVNDDDYDNADFALNCVMSVLNEADRWIKKLNINSIEEDTYSPDEEVNMKLKLLEKWVKSY